MPKTNFYEVITTNDSNSQEETVYQGTDYKQALEAYQRQLIRQALARCGNNWASAARALNLDASNLHKLARRLGVKP